MPETVAAAATKARLVELLRRAEGGGTRLITRHGKPAAALVPADHLDRVVALVAAAAPAPGVDGGPATRPGSGDFSVTRARSTLGLGSHNVTTDFRRATGAMRFGAYRPGSFSSESEES